MDIPRLSMKITGMRNESMETARTILVRITAITTYIGISSFVSSFISSTIAVMPLTKHCSPAIFLISATASSDSSADVDLLKNTAIIVESSLLNTS